MQHVDEWAGLGVDALRHGSGRKVEVMLHGSYPGEEVVQVVQHVGG